MVMTYSTAAELDVHVQALWTATDEIYFLEQLEVYVPLHRVMKFERWCKSNSLDYRITKQYCRVGGKSGYRAFLFTLHENTAGELNKLLTQFKRWDLTLTNYIRKSSNNTDDLETEDIAVTNVDSLDHYSLLAKAAEFLDSHATADINAVLEYLS